MPEARLIVWCAAATGATLGHIHCEAVVARLREVS